MGLLLLIVLFVLLFGALPTYPYSRNWGYAPSGLFGLLLLAAVVLLFVGTIPWGFSHPAYVVTRPVTVVNPTPVTVVNPPARVVVPPTIPPR